MASTKISALTAATSIGATDLITTVQAGVNKKAAANLISSVLTLAATQSGTASTPPLKATGAWFSGGSATTTKPQALIEASGATSTGWSTSGTGLGVNAASGFVGLLADFQTNGTSKASIDYAGKLTTSSAAVVGNVGFYNTAPIAQPAATASSETLLTNLGLRASGGLKAARRSRLMTSVDLNSANTDVATISGLPSKFMYSVLRVFDASVSLTTCSIQLWSGPGATGDSLITTLTPTGCTAPEKFVTAVVTAITGGAQYYTGPLYVRCVTPQGAPATASIWFEIIDLTNE